jgi:hypothetical protein
MKNTRKLIHCFVKTAYLLLLVMMYNVYGQVNFVYDQSSATNPVASSGYPIQADQPIGQSFTPTLSSVGFVQLLFGYGFPSNQLGATVLVNLWSGSISNGVLLSSTEPVFIPDGALNLVTNFTFLTPVTVTPGTTYFLQPYLQSGDTRVAVMASTGFNYPNGTLYWNGAPDPNNSDLWFREGIVVPEPSSSLLILLGSSVFLYARRIHKKHFRI